VLKVAKVEMSEADAGDEPEGFTFEAPGLAVPLMMSCGGTLDVEAAAANDTAAPALASAPSQTDVMEALPERIDVILDIDLPLIVRFGRTELPLKTLAKMGPGSLIDLGRSADDPVDVLVSNRVVARGEVVIVGGNYGVRILDVVSPKERIRSMEA
jgi:flagellar motor switch protein FliN/FliY